MKNSANNGEARLLVVHIECSDNVRYNVDNIAKGNTVGSRLN